MVRHAATMRRALFASCLLSIAACSPPPEPGTVVDEAKLAGRDAASFPQASED